MKAYIRRRAVMCLALVLTVAQLAGNAAAAETEPDQKEEMHLVLDADVGRIGCNIASFDVGEIHTWFLTASLPADIADAKAYTVTDKLDRRLTLQPESLQVLLKPSEGEPQMLQQDTHYHASAQYSEDGTLLSVALTGEGMAWAGKRSGFREGQLMISFRAAINRNAIMGETVSNRSGVSYTSASGTVFTADSDSPGVHTGGVVLRKTDAAGNPLAGAKFRICRIAGEEESEVTEKTEWLVLEEEAVPVVYREAYGRTDMGNGKVSEVQTDEAGIAVFYGLAYGTYYIVETQAPEGYNLLTQPIAVIIDASSHMTEADGWKDAEGNIVDNTVRVVNTKFLLPDSGGWGVEIYTVTGLWIMFAALMLIILNIRGRPFG